ncbi:nif-specific transcriptional activator NifA [Vibrio hangzhouensis]|uniref:Nif-specific regulatory protein n=1 Tax=Vibrio hangzhouensis TaxID=462991 RepID=A0A1H5TFR8_9VIBR|nr:nif-specific transcriptional activator NifA [Vibrio hangzhouensis]SEF61665.1 Nif-specific regulatory protein [Vibrio hangzhouensis]
MNNIHSIAQMEHLLLNSMYEISRELNSSLNYCESTSRVLRILHEECGLLCGVLAIKDLERNIMLVKSVHSPYSDDALDTNVSYKAGEGVIGEFLLQNSTIVIRDLSKDMRFANKLALYDYTKPFICVPLKDSSNHTIGALSAQPLYSSDDYISVLCRFLEMIASLIAKNVLLAHQVENKQVQLLKERDGLRRKIRNNYSFDNLVGHTQAMRQIFEQVRLVSKWDSTVLLRGESGTGKEVIANAIHYNSSRSNNTFVKLNCAALPDNLLESELFGHEKGAFTGAVKQRKGRFEMAHNGTIFLDEIGETSPAFQAKLLRVIQEQEFERVGGTDTISVDVRIIAATNRNLEAEVANDSFREDLYYRLNVMPMQLPPLRERLPDIPDLVEFMINNLSKKQKRKLSITDAALRVLMSHSWPGNVRELQNTIERAAILTESGVIEQNVILFPDKPSMVMPLSGQLNKQHQERPKPIAEVGRFTPSDERQAVIDALEQTGWVKAKAARLLNMTPRQIAYRIQIMNIDMKQL